MSATNATLLNNTSTGASVAAKTGQSASAFAASLVTSIVIFSIEVLCFLLIKDRLARIYQPRTFLVPERERTTPTIPGWWKWIKPILATSNSEFVQKCGLDAYFFLRYLRMLLKIFVPAALVILPILLPLNAVHGKGSDWAVGNFSHQANVSGLDQLSWANVSPYHTGRYWAHWLLAFAFVVYFCYICFDELRGYIRMRQAYITSPQHRLRASATTVLVSSIPYKWCTVEALDGLYDVFPGGLRNIWINRNFDELADKIKRRNELADTLEKQETQLIQKCFKKHEQALAKERKAQGKKDLSKDEKEHKAALQNEKAARNAVGLGLTTGDPHQVRHNLHEVLDEGHETDEDSVAPAEEELVNTKTKPFIPISVVGDGLHAVKEGIGSFGRGILGGIRGVNRGVNDTIDTTNGFAVELDQEPAGRQRSNTVSSEGISHAHPRTRAYPNPEVSAIEPQSGSHKVGIGNEQSWHQGRKPKKEEDQQPFAQPSPSSQADTLQQDKPEVPRNSSRFDSIKNAIGLGGKKAEAVEYPEAFDKQFEKDDDEAVWKQYLEAKDRDTSRLPFHGWNWMPALPFIGEKVDTIYHCRTEIARLNVEIEDDQAHPERFPIMNSAFIQFNHQVAAHMACQSLSHHLPKQMAPRLVEIDPNDVIWDNMSIPWWQAYIRTAMVLIIVAGMIVLWAIPVAFTSALSQLSVLAQTYHWLGWILDLPTWFRSFLQGVLPPALLALLMFLLPVILRLLVKLQGLQSGMLVELSVQKYYFFFLFVQLFLVVSVANAASTIISYFENIKTITQFPNILASQIPKASNYFFSYMLLQAMSVSAGALVQVGGLINWFIFAPLLDSTARAKFDRQTSLSDIQWGTFFPVYTNLACIGIIYSIISPLILIFNIITFALFWFVYRYNTLYVTKFTRDTGGLLFPNAINTMFTGIYVMEVVLTAMFFLIRDEHDNIACKGQAIGMIVILVLTIVFHWLLDEAFSPLFRYLPITLEDDAVRRDEEFARAMHKKRIGVIEDEIEGMDLQDELEECERQSREENRQAEEYELQHIKAEKERRLEQLKAEEPPELEPYEFQNPDVAMQLDSESRGYRNARKVAHKAADATLRKLPTNLPIPHTGEKHKLSWADRERNHRASHFGEYTTPSHHDGLASKSQLPHEPGPGIEEKSQPAKVLDKIHNFNPLMGGEKDVEAQQSARNQLSEALFAGVNDELEDLSPEQRDALVQRAFQHEALRARRPVTWIPRDELGVSDDEVMRMGRFSKSLWVSNVRQGLDAKGRCVYSGAPPDFSEVDLIQL